MCAIMHQLEDTDLDLAFPEIMDTSEVACRQDSHPQQTNTLGGKLRRQQLLQLI